MSIKNINPLKNLLAGAAVVAICASAPAFAQDAETDPNEPQVHATLSVNEFFIDFGWQWENESVYTGKVILYPYEDESRDEPLLFLCGAGFMTGDLSKDDDLTALRPIGLTINGQPVLLGFDYFAKVKNQKALDEATANCQFVSFEGELKETDEIGYFVATATPATPIDPKQ